MMAEFLDQRRHVETPRGPAAGGRVVVSRLPRGESLIARSALSLKIVLEGEEHYQIDGRTRRLTAGEIMVVEPGGDMRVTVPRAEGARGLCLYFPMEMTGELRAGEGALAASPLILPWVDHRLGRWLSRIGPALARHPSPGPATADRVLKTGSNRLRSFLDDTSCRLEGLAPVRPARRAELLRRVEIARAVLHASPARSIPLQELAEAAGLSPFHLARCFQAVHGTPPAAWHRAMRLDRAADRLARGVSPAVVTVEAGFADQAGFTRAFRRRFGVSPGQSGGLSKIRS